MFLYDNLESDIEKSMQFLKNNALSGDYAEFGVANGRSFVMAYHFAKLKGLKEMKFYAFDSFEGLPEPTGIDKNASWKAGDYKHSLHEFTRTLMIKGVDLRKVKPVKGWFNETLKEPHGINKLSYVYIDCDYYESTKDVLKFIKPFLQEGTIVSFADWYMFKGNPNYGEQKAFHEFLKKEKDLFFTDFPSTGLGSKSFITHLKN